MRFGAFTQQQMHGRLTLWGGVAGSLILCATAWAYGHVQEAESPLTTAQTVSVSTVHSKHVVHQTDNYLHTFSAEAAHQAVAGVPAPAWPAAPEGTALAMRCLHAQNTLTALVGGELNVDGTTLHSSLFMTQNGGNSWQAVGPAIPGSQILAIHMDPTGSIWALGQSTLQEKEPFVLTSQDQGEHWQQHSLSIADLFPHLVPSKLPKTILCAHFTFAEDGLAQLMTRFKEIPDQVACLTGRKHGSSWSVNHLFQEMNPLMEAGGAFFNFGNDNIEYTTQDGTGWRITPQQIILREIDDQWEPVLEQPADDFEPPQPSGSFFATIK